MRWRVLVLNNGDLNMVTWEQRALSGDPKFPASQDLPAFSYAAYARSLGFAGVEMRRPDDVARGWDEALAQRQPVVVDAYTDPDVPPLPPHIEPAQAKRFIEAIFKGDPDRWQVIKESAKQMWAGFLGTRR